MRKYKRFIGISALWVTFFLNLSMAESAPGDNVVFWTTENQPKRMSLQNDLAKRFTAATNVEVEVVPVEESELAIRIMAAAAADALPDMVFVSLDFVISWTEEGILDPEAATRVIKALGMDTFASGPLNLAAVSGGWAAIPADGWGQLLLFRKDLFSGRAPEVLLGSPNTWDRILMAAQALHNPPKIWGTAVGTDPTQVYMQQVLEHFALSNGARLVNPKTGEVDLITPEFVQTLKFYKGLADLTPPGDIYWRQTREDYFAGRVAMIVWSPYILDELAGLRGSTPVTVEGLAKPLHEMTGIVTAFQGPMGTKPAQWGQVSYFGITVGASENAAKLAGFLLGEGYLDWLSMAPEGKFPLRPRFVEGWKQLRIGVDRTAKISDLYSDEVVDNIIAGVDNFDRWGFGAGKGACIGKIYGTKEVIRLLRRFLDGEISAEAAAAQMTETVRGLEGCR
jgi:multiple sugar transport system substrate-binding protein